MSGKTCVKLYPIDFHDAQGPSCAVVGGTHLGVGPPQHLLHHLHPLQPRQEVQQDRDDHHGEAQERHLPLPGQGDLPVSG